MAGFQLAKGSGRFQGALLGIQGVQDFDGCFRHEAFQQHAGNADAFQQVVQNRLQTGRLFGVFGQYPGFGFIDVFVGTAQQRENFVERSADLEGFHFLFGFFHRQAGGFLQLFIHRFGNVRIFNHAVKIFVFHRDGTADQVSKNIGQIGVDALHDQIPGNGAILGKRHFVQAIVADCVHAKVVDQFFRVNDIAFGFGHFALANQHPGVREHLFGQRQIQGH